MSLEGSLLQNGQVRSKTWRDPSELLGNANDYRGRGCRRRQDLRENLTFAGLCHERIYLHPRSSSVM